MSRSADATILGYYYQFDTTVFQLLDLKNDTDYVVVEGIEDIDVFSATAADIIQCKYLSKENLTNSVIREPVTLLLDNYRKDPLNGMRYTLYAHFSKETPGNEPVIDLQRLKEILTYKENKIQKSHYIDNGIDDATLGGFLTKFKLSFGMDFDTQQNLVLNKLKSCFKCTDFEADTFYYNNALRIIIDKAKEKNINERKIIKSDFLKAINGSQKLFNEWYIRLRTKQSFLNSIRDHLKATKALDPARAKCIFIGKEIIEADNHSLPFISLIENLINKYYRMGISLRDALPVIIILETDEKMMIEFKKELISRNILYNDGYEDLIFSDTFFNSNPIINTTPSGNKISKSSFSLKLLRMNTFATYHHNINKPRVVLHFANSICPYPKGKEYQWFDIKYCETLTDISSLIL